MQLRAILLLLLLALAVPAQAGGQSFIFIEALFDGTVQGTETIDGLNFVFATAVSTDGENVYACSGNNNVILPPGSPNEDDNAIAAFSRDAAGRLTFLAALFDDGDANNPGPADGLLGCRDVAVSPDGDHVYTAGFSENEIGIFTRNIVSGEIAFRDVVADGFGLDGLAGVEAIALAPNGSVLFAAGSIDDSVVALTRNSVTGALIFTDSVRQGLGGVSGLDRPIDVAVSPDGRHVYAASGSNANFTGSDALTALSWNAAMGDLTFIESYTEGQIQGARTIDGLDRVSAVAVSPDGGHVYASGGLQISSDQDWIAVFSRDNATGRLTFEEAIDHFTFCALEVLFEFETDLLLSPDGTRLFVTSPATALVEFARNATTGALTFADAKCFFDGEAPGTNLPRKISRDFTGTHVYVPGNASNALAVFDTDGIFADGFESGNTVRWSSVVP